jgi:predicted CXXCH cytochrome family protein
MTSRPALLLAALAALALPAAGRAADPYKLKKGAEGQLCLGCHVKFEAQLKKPAVHTPVKARQCAGCHSPHASQHGKLLADDVGLICQRCHGSVVPKAPKSIHKPVAENACATCHAPHASDNPKVLTQPVAALCASCHKQIATAAAEAKFKHRPVQQGGCTTCHDPHGSAASDSLLVKPEPQLCLGCHKADKPIFAKWHMGYQVASARCTSCHDPHGSKQKSMLYDTVHSPVAKGMCSQCHEAPGSGFKPKLVGAELCNRCHAQAVSAMLAKGDVHRPVVDRDACITCHDPHASKRKKLLADDPIALCGKCHEDTIRRHDRSPTKHEPIAQGDCVTCHDPHASENPMLFAKATPTETCGQCHDYTKHATHPIGEKAVDPRNKNMNVECVSCHRAHGTEYKRLMPFAVTADLCTKCHEKYKR